MPQTRFHQLFQERALKEIEKANQELASGAAKDFGQYRDYVGYIRGLGDALRLCDEIEREYD